MDESAYRTAERRFWSSVNLQPGERRVRLASTGTEVRVQEVGEGDPVLFIHGGPNSGSTWVPLVAYLSGYRCLLVDRPGTGLSEHYQIDAGNLEGVGSRFVADILDGLEIDRAHVVASSFGGHLALRSAADHPERFRRMVQMACPALAPGEQEPPFLRFLKYSSIRWLLNKIPPSNRANRNIMRQIGHGASLDADRIPSDFFDWYLALLGCTNTMKNDGELIASVVTRRPALTLSDELLGSVTVPTLFLWGEDDTFGGANVAHHIVSCMPNASVTMIPEAGHLPWLDDPRGAARATAAFLSQVDGRSEPLSAFREVEGVAR